MFGSDTNKSAICKTVLEAYRTRGENVASSDPVINDSLMYMCKILHDSVEYIVHDQRQTYPTYHVLKSLSLYYFQLVDRSRRSSSN